MVSGKYFHQIEPVDVMEEARRRKFRPVEKNRRRDGGIDSLSPDRQTVRNRKIERGRTRLIYPLDVSRRGSMIPGGCCGGP